MKAKRGFSREKAYKSRVEFMQHWGLYLVQQQSSQLPPHPILYYHINGIKTIQSSMEQI
jgi:hypothetical protein